LALGSLAVVLALTGCAGRSWQFWKSSTPAPTRVGTERTIPASPTPSGAAAHAAPTPGPMATAPAPETVAAAVPSDRDFVEAPALNDVLFRPGFVTVGKADAKTLDAVVRWLTENPGSHVRIEGHTDDLGSPNENLAIGKQRAASAMKYLVAKGVEPDRVSIVSYGSERPVCMEKTTVCRAKNRRVHFLVRQP
jgi:peptidoglycan-associated lipoprotein